MLATQVSHELVVSHSGFGFTRPFWERATADNIREQLHTQSWTVNSPEKLDFLGASLNRCWLKPDARLCVVSSVSM